MTEKNINNCRNQATDENVICISCTTCSYYDSLPNSKHFILQLVDIIFSGYKYSFYYLAHLYINYLCDVESTDTYYVMYWLPIGHWPILKTGVEVEIRHISTVNILQNKPIITIEFKNEVTQGISINIFAFELSQVHRSRS